MMVNDGDEMNDAEVMSLKKATVNIQTATRAKENRNHVFEAEWRGKLFQMKVFHAAIASVKFSSKLEPYS